MIVWSVFLLNIFLPSAALGQDMDDMSASVKSRVVDLRNLNFLREIEQDHQSVEELQHVLQREIARTYPENALAVLEERLLKFGFVASPIDLQTQLIRMFSQQIAGYYDPREKKMVLIENSPGATSSGGMLPIELLSQWLISSAGLSLEEILLSHELTHAMQDQHFDLLSLPIEALDPEDTTSAVTALIEGDATIVMFDYMLAPQGLDVTRAPELSHNLHVWVESPFVRGFSMFQTVPRYLMDNLLFPYVYGFDFVLYLKQRGGWDEVNRAYQDFPVSTEQVLHPEKYFDQRDMPTLITLPTLPKTAYKWQEVEQNTLGEFNISILLDGYLTSADARTASAGWDGDRFALLTHADTQSLLLAWYTAWDSEQESKDFFHKKAAFLDRRYARDTPEGERPDQRSTESTFRQWTVPGGEVLLERIGQDVILLDGIPAEEIEFWRTLFWSSQVERHE
jgi:hypothetical protein